MPSGKPGRREARASAVGLPEQLLRALPRTYFFRQLSSAGAKGCAAPPRGSRRRHRGATAVETRAFDAPPTRLGLKTPEAEWLSLPGAWWRSATSRRSLARSKRPAHRCAALFFLFFQRFSAAGRKQRFVALLAVKSSWAAEDSEDGKLRSSPYIKSARLNSSELASLNSVSPSLVAAYPCGVSSSVPRFPLAWWSLWLVLAENGSGRLSRVPGPNASKLSRHKTSENVSWANIKQISLPKHYQAVVITHWRNLVRMW